jgi:hypothetical protein
MERLSKEKSGESSRVALCQTDFIRLDVILRNEFIQGCLRDEFLRKILAPNTALQVEGHSIESIPNDSHAVAINETGAAV